MKNIRLVLSNIKKEYDSRVVLEIDRLVINYNQVTTIVGSSGAGKSTLLNILGTLEIPTSGSIIIEEPGNKDFNLFDNADYYRKRKVGFIFQDMNLIDGLSVFDNIKVAKDLSNDGNLGEINEVLSNFSLNKNIKQNSSTLSGGEKQRVAIARAISKKSEIILADEPSGNLDSENADIVFSTLRNIREGRCVVIITHDLQLAKKYSDRIITLKDGKITSDIINKPKCEINDSVTLAQKEKKVKKESRLLSFLKTIGLNSIKKRLFRLLSTSIVLGMSISNIVTLINYNQLGKTIANDTNRNYLEADLISIKKKETLMMRNPGFEDKSVLDIFNGYHINNYVEDYSYGRFSINFYFNDISVPQDYVAIKSISTNDFFKNRIINEKNNGDFPSNSNEIIIGKSVAAYLNESNPTSIIGEQMVLQDGYGNSFITNIVGINNIENTEHKYYSYIPSDLIKQIREKNIKSSFSEIRETKTTRTLGIDKSVNLKFQSYETIDGSEEIVISNNQFVHKSDVVNILISSAIFAQTFDNRLYGEDFNSRFNTVSSLDFSICNDIVHKCKIVGVYNSKNYNIKLFNDDVDKIFTVYPSMYYVYIHEMEKSPEIVKELSEKYEDYVIISEYENLILGVTNNYRFFSLALVIVSILFSIISIFLVYSLVKFINFERTKEIGILKSLGASTKICFSVLLCDIAFISFSMLVSSVIFSEIIYFIVPLVFTDYSFFNIKFPIGYTFGIWGIFTLLIVSFTSIFILRTAKKPAKYLLNRYV